MKNKLKTILLAMVCVFCMLAGTIVPANVTVLAENASPGLGYGFSVSDGQLFWEVYGYRLEHISSFTFHLDYDTTLLRLADYEMGSRVESSVSSVYDNQGRITLAIADDQGFSINGDCIIRFSFDMLYDGEQELTYDIGVDECVNRDLEDVSIQYESRWSGQITNSQETFYTVAFEDSYQVDTNAVCVNRFGFSRNAGFYSGSFTLSYNPQELEFQSVKANDNVEGMIVSYNKIQDGEVQVAFASTTGYSKTLKFLDFEFLPLQSSAWSYFYINNLVITNLDLKEVAFSKSYSSSIYTSGVSGTNYFKLSGPDTLEAMGTFEVKLEVVDNSGFSAMTATLQYDADLFEFVECNTSEGVCKSALTNVSGSTSGKVKIAVVSAQNLEESGTVATITLKSIKNVKKTADFCLVMDELVDSGANPVDYSLGKWQMQVYKCCIEGKHDVVMDKAVAATCTTAGKTQGSHCSKCGEILEEQKEVAATGHKGGTATCSAKAVCRICGRAYGKVNASRHVKTVVRNAKAATYAKKGYTGDRYCSKCGKKISKGKAIAKLKVAPVKLSSVKSSKKKTITIKWKKNKKASGYVISYSTSKKFTKKTTKKLTIKSAKTVSRRVKGLKAGKKYYVRIRAYKTVKKTKYYSKWSGVKSVKVKK